MLFKDGKPYRGVGANYFDLFLRVLHAPTDTTSLTGLQRLGAAGIPFVRFAVAYGESDWKRFFNDREEFLRRLDMVVQTAERANVGLVPSFFWDFRVSPTLPTSGATSGAIPTARLALGCGGSSARLSSITNSHLPFGPGVRQRA